jgi:sugar (pentulose or hexulose) kinase
MIFCGIDLGTTNTKAVLIDEQNRLIDSICLPAESDISDLKMLWYNQFCRVFDYFSSKNLLNCGKTACGITSQGGSFILLDKQFKPVSRPYSWTEFAGEATVDNLTIAFGKKSYYRTTGWEPSNWLMACKLKELSDKKLFPANTHYIATVPDFIFANLTGQFITDITNAQITGLCNFANSAWDDKILAWAGIDRAFLPRIIDQQAVVFDNIQTPWGKISFTTSSHDQYAAMQAAGLEKDTDMMIGTGTAWVLNARTTLPFFDDRHFMAHPGRDIFADSFGNIIATGAISKPIGMEFDRLLKKFHLDHKKLGLMENDFGGIPLPSQTVDLDCLGNSITAQLPSENIKRYMEGSASLAAFLLEQFLPARPCKIIMSGGAAASAFWPQAIADLCRTAVEAFDFPQFTAYGAALYAKSAYGDKKNAMVLPAGIQKHSYEPANADSYRRWYLEYQKPMLEKKLNR